MSHNSSLQDLTDTWTSLVSDKLRHFYSDEGEQIADGTHRLGPAERDHAHRLQEAFAASLDERILEKKLFEGFTGLSFA
jgi:hypothetical protein